MGFSLVSVVSFEAFEVSCCFEFSCVSDLVFVAFHLSVLQVHLKFEINPYDPVILRQLFLSNSEQGLGTESRRPTLAWLEDSSSCSDLPKLEGDRYASNRNISCFSDCDCPG